MTTEIIAIGNELLIGDVLDTNTHWLCRRVTGLGGVISRVTLIGDDREVIAGVLQDALAREARVIVTTGGLGPTADDLTLSAVARALGLPLVESERALQMVQTTYTQLAAAGLVAHDTLTEERRKMAILPAGALPLFNPVGAAPGVVMRHGASTIICLPGVPEEMKGIFETSLPTLLAELYGEAYYAERVAQLDCGDESMLAPIVDCLAIAHPSVYVKSRAKAYGPDVRLKVTLSARGPNQSQVDGWLDAALHDLCAGLRAAGISIISLL